MRGRRVISLLLSLVMALSLCSGVWATGEVGGDPTPTKKTQSDAGYEFVINKENNQNDKQTLYFFNQIDDGYMTYNRNVTGFRVAEGRIAAFRAYPLNANDAIFLAFKYDGSLGNIAEGADASGIINEHVDTENGKTQKFSVTYENTDDANLYVIRLTAKEALGTNGSTDFFDFSFFVGTGESRQEYQFAMEFGEDNSQQIMPLTDFKGVLAENENGKDENDNSKLTDAQKNAANDYVDKYLLNNNGYVKNGDSDTTGILLKDGKDYTAAEVAAIKAAVKAFRAAEWQVRDALGNVQGVQIEDGWTDCFGRYLAELASRVGISLWGDYPSGDNAGVFMTLTGGSRLQLATDNAYGVLAYDESVNVKADEQAATYEVPYDRNHYAFAVTRTDDKRITSVKVENADCKEMAENGEVYGQKCTVVNGESNSFEVNTYNNGWSISNEIAKSYFEINVDRWDEEFELTFIINYVSDSNDTETAEDKFTIKFVEPVCDWTFNNGSKPTNASELLNVFYNKGYKFPKLESYAAISDGELLSANGFDLHLAFPMELKKWETGCGDDWDYKVEIDEAKGTVTVKVNYGSAARWDAAARNMLETDAFVDGVYFSYWFGGSPYAKSVRYGMNLYDVLGDNISTTTIDKLADTLNNTKLVSNYYHSNGLGMAQLNKQNATTSLLTISDKETYLVSIAMDDEQADKNMGNAKYRYALLINVEPTASMAVKMEGTGLPKVTPERMRVTNETSGWKAIVPEKATDSIFLRSEDYTTTYNGTHIADLTVDAPTGYKLVSWSADWREDNDDTTKMPIHLYKTQVNNVIITWKNTVTGEKLMESVVVEAGSTQSWMDTLADGTVTVNKPQTVSVLFPKAL